MSRFLVSKKEGFLKDGPFLFKPHPSFKFLVNVITITTNVKFHNKIIRNDRLFESFIRHLSLFQLSLL